MQKCHHGRDLEEREGEGERCRDLSNTIKKVHDAFLAHHVHIDVHALPETADVRRCEQSSTKASLLECGCRFEADRAFAVGACDMDDLIRVLRVAECLRTAGHVLEGGLWRGRPTLRNDNLLGANIPTIERIENGFVRLDRLKS